MLLSKANLSTCALDSIPFCLFKDMAPSPTLIFLYIIDFSLFLSIFPTSSKYADILPFYKILLTFLPATALFPSFFLQLEKDVSKVFFPFSFYN